MPDRIHRRRPLRPAIGSLVVLMMTVVLACAAASAQARTVSVTERTQLRLVRQRDATVDLRGMARGTLSGPVLARFNVRVLSVTGLVTIYPKGGGSLSFSIAGHARSAGVRARFSGTVTVTGGSGRWAGARGRGTFSGVVNRRTWDASATVRARITT